MPENIEAHVLRRVEHDVVAVREGEGRFVRSPAVLRKERREPFTEHDVVIVKYVRGSESNCEQDSRTL